MSNQSKRQESVRAITGTALSYEGDWHALFTQTGIADGAFNGRMLDYINYALGTSYVELSGAMQAFAVARSKSSALSWNELGSFTVAPIAFQNFLTTSTQPTWLSNSGTNGNRMLFDSSGKLTWAPHNLLINTGALSTQTVTLGVAAGFDYILSFTGTGSVAISGGYTGTLAGTGAANRVYLKFTTTTASLTFTVTGSVTLAQLERVTYQTTPSTYLASGATASFGVRFDFDPATLNPKGLLIEESRRNLLTYSDQFDNAAWSKTRLNTTGTPPWVNVAVGPYGTTTADKLIEDSTNFSHFTNQLATVTNGATYTYSIFAKAGERNYLTIYAVNTAAAFNTFFNLSNGTVVSVSPNATAAVVAVGNGIYRCSVTTTATSTTTGIYPGISADGVNATYQGNGSSGIFAEAATIEAGSWASSMIQTAASAVTRAADVLSAASYASNPAIIQYRRISDGVRLRKALASFSSISSETNMWIEAVAIYPTGTPAAIYNNYLTVDGPYS